MDLLALASGLAPPPARRVEQTERTEGADGTEQAEAATPATLRAKKRSRAHTRDDILRALAKDALDAMRGQGLSVPANASVNVVVNGAGGGRAGDLKETGKRMKRGPGALFPPGKENAPSPNAKCARVRPQSPESFYRSIGLDPPATRLPASASMQSVSARTACVTATPPLKKRAPRRRASDGNAQGSITPSRVQAAKSLLSLMK